MSNNPILNNLVLPHDPNCGVYAIYCLVTKKSYIGSSKNLYKRLYDHKLYLNNNSHYNKHLQRAWNKYWGECNFQCFIIEICKEEELEIREQWWIDITDCYHKGYNGRPTANNNSGYVWTEEQKLNLSRAKKGFKHTEEAKKKISINSIGKKFKTEEHKKKISLGKTGKKFSEEIRAKFASHPRKLDKWPHELGSKCKCRECKDKFNLYLKKRRANIRNIKNAE